MTLRALLALVVLTLTSAFASPATVSVQLAQSLQGLPLACPEPYHDASCVWAAGSIIDVARRVSTLHPDLLPEPWREGPDGGLVTDIEGNTALLSLIPRGLEQVLIVVQSTGTGTAVTPSPTGVPVVPVVLDNPDGRYVVLLTQDNLPVQNLSAVPAGTYTLITSGYAQVTQRLTITVAASGPTHLTVPRLVSAPPKPGTGGLQLPFAPGFVFLIFAADGTLVLDADDLLPGTYDIRSSLNGAVGPVAPAQAVVPGVITMPQFTGSFLVSVPTAPPASPVPTPTVTPAATPRVSSGQCYVNGYRRSNGTYVSGYWRRC